jgi:hypothetical protein
MRIAVFDFVAQDEVERTAGRASDLFAATLAELITGGQVVPQRVLRDDLGIDPGVPARNCHGDLLCLTQVGTACAVDRLILPRMTAAPGGVRIDVMLLDVASAQVVKRVERVVPDTPPESLELSLDALARELLELTPRGGIAVSANVAGAQVTLDGRAVGAAPLTRADLEVGAHRVSVGADGHRAFDAEVAVTAGETTVVEARLERLPDPVEARGWGDAFVHPATLGLLGVGVAALGAATAFAVLGKGAEDDARALRALPVAEQARGGGQPRIVALRDTANTRYLVANVLFGAGGAAVAAGLVWFALDGSGTLRGGAADVTQILVSPRGVALVRRF